MYTLYIMSLMHLILCIYVVIYTYGIKYKLCLCMHVYIYIYKLNTRYMQVLWYYTFLSLHHIRTIIHIRNCLILN